MADNETRPNGLPALAVAGLLVAVAAGVIGVVALQRAGSGGSVIPMDGMAMGDMEHMSPVEIDGIADAPADDGNTPLRGTVRNGALEFTLDARPVWWRIFGTQKVAAWAYNGIVPGPVISVRNGQRVRIRFTNHLPEPTTVHWHGIGVPNSQDGVPDVTQKAIAPGASFTYEFVARPAGDPDGAGTFLYHSHVDEDRQMSVGLSGVFIIRPRVAEAAEVTERTLVFSEWTVDASTGRTRGVMPMEGMFPNFFTINGKSFPDTAPISVPRNRTVLLRLVNAGQFAHPIHLHGTAFRVVARDGHAIPAGRQELRDTLTLESGERADIAFRLPPGKWVLHCHIGHHLTNDGHGPGGLLTTVTAA